MKSLTDHLGSNSVLLKSSRVEFLKFGMFLAVFRIFEAENRSVWTRLARIIRVVSEGLAYPNTGFSVRRDRLPSGWGDAKTWFYVWKGRVGDGAIKKSADLLPAVAIEKVELQQPFGAC